MKKSKKIWLISALMAATPLIGVVAISCGNGNNNKNPDENETGGMDDKGKTQPIKKTIPGDYLIKGTLTQSQLNNIFYHFNFNVTDAGAELQTSEAIKKIKEIKDRIISGIASAVKKPNRIFQKVINDPEFKKYFTVSYPNPQIGSSHRLEIEIFPEADSSVFLGPDIKTGIPFIKYRVNCLDKSRRDDKGNIHYSYEDERLVYLDNGN